MDLSIITDLEDERDRLRQYAEDLSIELHRVNALCNQMRLERDEAVELLRYWDTNTNWALTKLSPSAKQTKIDASAFLSRLEVKP